MIHQAIISGYFREWAMTTPSTFGRGQYPAVANYLMQTAPRSRALGVAGQRLGGIGFYRTETGQPRFNEVSGAYTFDTYITTYTFANGMYSFALQVSLSLAESFNVADTAAPTTNYSLALSEAFNAADVESVIRVMPVALTESVVLADVVSLNGIYGVVLPEALVVSDTVSPNSSLIAYAVNLNNGALTTYENFNFNSFATMGGKFYGMTDAGVMELTGADDAGEAIDASVKFGTTSLETEFISADKMKHLPAAYLGIDTDGDMVLQVTTNGTTNAYRLVEATTTSLHHGRLLLGKGVVAKYWDFELVNVDGADFTLESVTLTPEVLIRRIGGR